MAKNNQQLVAYVDAETSKRFSDLSKRHGDSASALLRKLVLRAIEENAAGVFDPRPSGSRGRQPGTDLK